jgi:hypothetical protein
LREIAQAEAHRVSLASIHTRTLGTKHGNRLSVRTSVILIRQRRELFRAYVRISIGAACQLGFYLRAWLALVFGRNECVSNSSADSKVQPYFVDSKRGQKLSPICRGPLEHVANSE